MKKNNKIYYWACDSLSNTGEGKLALFFLKDLREKSKIQKINKRRTRITVLNKFLNLNYILPFQGVYYCWKYYLKKKKISYVNYLPLWNFLIFLLLPPKTIIGPITGGAKYKNKFNLIRSLFFPLFYKISDVIINYRNYDLIFSTDLLKKYVSRKNKTKNKYNFIIKKFNKKNKKIKKNLDFIIYYRNHKNKKNFFPIKLIKNLILLKFKINVVGDKLNLKKVINHGRLSNYKIKKLQARSRFSVVSNENIYSLFTLECLINNVKVLTDQKINNIKFFKKCFIHKNFDNMKELSLLKKLY